LIAARSVSKRYGQKEVLTGIDLDVQRGEALAVIGPTGAGKTTLLRILDLLEKPTSGKVFFNGQDTSASDKLRLHLRRRMAMVFQKPIGFNTSVYNNVAYGLSLRRERNPNRHRKVLKTLEMVGLAGYEGRNVRTLSGGEVQRVALARAIVTEPEVLLLDEPTANLDPVSTAQIEQLIAKIIAELGTTVIMATHDLSQGQRLAHRIGVLIHGLMLQSGGVEEVFTKPKTREIAQFVGVENIFEGVIAANDEGLAAIQIGGGVIEGLSYLEPATEALACIRPEEVILALSPPTTSARNHFPGQITKIIPFGPVARVEIDCGFPLVAMVTRRSIEELGLAEGKEVFASFKATGVHVIKRQTE